MCQVEGVSVIIRAFKGFVKRVQDGTKEFLRVMLSIAAEKWIYDADAIVERTGYHGLIHA